MGHFTHLPAGLGATAARLGALPAVVHVVSVFLAFGPAGVADVGAELAKLPSKLAIAGHETDGSVADFGAVAVEADALHHHFYVLFAEAGVGAVVAGQCAGLAGFDAILVRLVCHVRFCLVQPDGSKTHSSARKEHTVIFFETN